MAKKILPKPIDPDAGFCTTCPYCNEVGDLYVISGEFFAIGIHLREDGFAFQDANQVSTEDEQVRCSSCRKEFSLAEVTR